MLRYHIDLFWSDDDGCWVANVPDLKSCSAFGDTPEEALAEVQVAMQGWLEVARDMNFSIPEPLYRAVPHAAKHAA
ncbi:type II toxin-antitoxin system HicB family antitoxin [Sphingomonas sp. MMS24-J45]|uniref:type II toxin-antitoxin system HicB family antitoxin n=1 Tax=Sphingomonas sp. MMS24-J45 TaxID=3238806 RepID=UPI00384DAB1D